MTPYAILDNMLISYDDENSLKEKIKFALNAKLGGFMVLYLDTDDFRGDCSEDTSNNNNKFPLIRAINKVIEQTVNSTKEDKKEKNVTASQFHIDNNDKENKVIIPNEKNNVSTIKQNILIFVYVFLILYYFK